MKETAWQHQGRSRKGRCISDSLADGTSSCSAKNGRLKDKSHWIFVQQVMMKVRVVQTGTVISKKNLQSDYHNQNTNTQLSAGRMPFWLFNQQCQSRQETWLDHTRCQTMAVLKSIASHSVTPGGNSAITEHYNNVLFNNPLATVSKTETKFIKLIP